jgi:hypothetical protein
MGWHIFLGEEREKKKKTNHHLITAIWLTRAALVYVPLCEPSSKMTDSCFLCREALRMLSKGHRLLPHAGACVARPQQLFSSFFYNLICERLKCP